MQVKLPKRASPIAKIRRKWGRTEGAKYADYARVMNSDAIQNLEGEACHDDLACEESLAHVQGKPRIRIRSGGVYW